MGKYADCDVVNASDYAEIGGIPLASFGAVFYFAILVLTVMFPLTTALFPLGRRILGWLTLSGLAIDIGLVFVQTAVLKTFCVLCVFTQLMTLCIFVALCAQHEKWKQGLFSAAWAVLSEKVSLWPTGSKLSKATLVLSATSLCVFSLCVAFLPSFVRIRSHQYALIDNALEQFYEQWKDRPVRSIETSPEDGSFGTPGSKVKIVEFSDFECPHCQKAAFTLHTALRPLSDRVFFVFKHYPLDSSCNNALQQQMHSQACSLARLAYCAGQKGKFWDYHDIVFLKLSEDDLKTGVDSIAPSLAPVFERAEITSCLRSERSLRRVTEDIRLGNKLGIRGTPSLFINGKLVTIPTTIETLNRLVEIEEKLVK